MKKSLSLVLVIIMLFSTVSINVSASTTPSDWALNEVNNAKNAGIITNAITKNYQKDITREEFCELVVKLYEKLTNQIATTGTDIFADTDNQEILKAYNLGIVKGVSSNQFAPYNNITRQEICVMLTRCIDIAIDGSDISNFKTKSFADRDKIADWAVDSVDYAFDNNIIKGIGENKVDPLGNTTCEQAVLLAYRIFANRNNLVVYDDLEENDLRDLFSVKDKINTSVKEYTNSEGKINISSLDNVINKVADVSKELKENNEILDYNKDENTVWLKLNSGLHFVYVPEIDGYDLGGNSISIMTYQPFNSDYGTERPGSGDMERGIEATDGSAQNISNKFSKYSFTQNYDDGQVTLDSLKQIGSNQIILWHGHGGYNSSIHSFLGIGEQLDETKFLWDPVYYIKNMKYTGDYLSGRIVCLSSGNIGVTSKFFTKYLPQMSNAFVYLGACESAHDSVLVDSFISKGATTVIGNSATIYTQYNQKMIKSTCDGLMMKNSNSQYNTILEAQNYAKSIHGNTDGSEYNATPVIYGNLSLRLSHEQSEYINHTLLSCIGKSKTDIVNLYGPIVNSTYWLGGKYYIHQNMSSEFFYKHTGDYDYNKHDDVNNSTKCDHLYTSISELMLTPNKKTYTISELEDIFGDYELYDDLDSDYYALCTYTFSYKDYKLIVEADHLNPTVDTLYVFKNNPIDDAYAEFIDKFQQTPLSMQAMPYSTIVNDQEMLTSMQEILSYGYLDVDMNGQDELIISSKILSSEYDMGGSCFSLWGYSSDRGVYNIFAKAGMLARSANTYSFIEYDDQVFLYEGTSMSSSEGALSFKNLYQIKDGQVVPFLNLCYNTYDNIYTVNEQPSSALDVLSAMQKLNEYPVLIKQVFDY